MSLLLEVNGQPFGNFTSSSVSRSMETLAGTFTYVATIGDSFSNFPIKLGDEVKIIARNEFNGAEVTLITGFAEIVEPSYDNESHDITISGRDKTCDAIDSSIVENINFGKKITLQALIQRVLDGNNIDLKVLTDIEIDPFSSSNGELVDAHVGENVFEFIDNYCKKRQVFATSNSDSNIVLVQAASELLSTKLVHFQDSVENNILSASASYSTENRFNSYGVFTQLSLQISSFLDSIPKSIANQFGESFDNEIRDSRKLIMVEDVNNSAVCKDRAIWESNLRRARSFNYTVDVQGFFLSEKSDQIWETNKLVTVQDEKSDIFGELLIKSIDYNFSLDGSITTMTMGFKDSFTLQAQIDAADARSNQAGNNV